MGKAWSVFSSKRAHRSLRSRNASRSCPVLINPCSKCAGVRPERSARTLALPLIAFHATAVGCSLRRARAQLRRRPPVRNCSESSSDSQEAMRIGVRPARGTSWMRGATEFALFAPKAIPLRRERSWCARATSSGTAELDGSVRPLRQTHSSHALRMLTLRRLRVARQMSRSGRDATTACHCSSDAIRSACGPSAKKP